MRYLEMGQTGVQVSVIGQGTWKMGEDPAKHSREVDALRVGIEAGMNLIDTAEMYADGGAERVVADAIADCREDVFVVTKVWPTHATYADTLRAAKERSAREYSQDAERAFFFFLSLGKVVQPVDLHQKIAASLVSRPLNPEATRQEIRIVFYRVVWKGDGQVDNQYIPPGTQYMEMVRDPKIYQQFFARLSKAVFLEAHRI